MQCDAFMSGSGACAKHTVSMCRIKDWGLHVQTGEEREKILCLVIKTAVKKKAARGCLCVHVQSCGQSRN